MRIHSLHSEEHILEELGRRLTKTRRQNYIAEKAFAETAGIDIRDLRRIEKGWDGSMKNWLKIMKALDLIESINQIVPEPVSHRSSRTRN